MSKTRSKARTMTVRMIAMLLGVFLLFGAVFGYGALRSYFIAKFLAGFANQIQTVATVTAEKTSWQPTVSAVGSITAVNGAELSAEVAGIVDSIHFESGTDVKKGDLLLTLRPNNDPAVLAQLQATAKLDEITYARDVKQFHADAISQAQVDTDRANLAAVQAQVQGQQALMDEKIVRAPFSGRLGIRQVNLGQYLPVGTEIVALEQLNPLYVDFYLPQQALAQLVIGQNLQISVDAFPGQSFAAKVSAIGANVDSATRMVSVRATLPNAKLLLRPGMFATIKLDVGVPAQEVTLPQTAITYNPYGDTVYILHPYHAPANAPKTAKPVPAGTYVASEQFVTTGDTRGDQVAVTQGVNPGDIVVSAGQLKLRNGALVSINNTVQPPDSPNPNPPNE